MEQATLIQSRFDSDLALLRAKRKKSLGEAALRQAKFDLREARQAQVLYDGSFRAFRDRLTGKKEETETALRHAVQKAEADLAAAQQLIPAAEAQIRALEESLSQLPLWEALKTPECEPLWYRLETLFCVEMLMPLLAANHLLLLERRNQFNGAHAGELKTWQTLAEIYTAPEAAGEACKPYVLRLRDALQFLDISFPAGTFFDNPTAFLSSATQYTRMDRINTAIAQVEAMQRLLPKLQKELSE